MAVKHIAVFLVLAAVYVVWTMISKRKEAADKPASEAPAARPSDADG